MSPAITPIVAAITSASNAPARLNRPAIQQPGQHVATAAVEAERDGRRGPGRARRRSRRSSGRAGASSGAKTALNATSASTTSVTSPIGFFSSRLNSDTRGLCVAASTIRASVVLDRIDQRSWFGHDRRTFGLSQPWIRSMTRLTMTTSRGRGDDQAHHHGDVALAGRVDGDLPEPGDREHPLDDDGPAEQADELHGQHGERRAAGVAQHVFEHHAVEGQAAAAQRAHVVLAQRVDDRSADLAGDTGDAADGERDDRQGDCWTASPSASR